ncbi:hypothetical protein QBC44DRAFT_306708 [Cladorrhinum sp. PSN332]|nr:hypothetical protein QBC44DRAFT_306708 [Cladorrhinum sp. PSN332]
MKGLRQQIEGDTRKPGNETKIRTSEEAAAARKPANNTPGVLGLVIGSGSPPVQAPDRLTNRLVVKQVEAARQQPNPQWGMAIGTPSPQSSDPSIRFCLSRRKLRLEQPATAHSWKQEGRKSELSTCVFFWQTAILMSPSAVNMLPSALARAERRGKEGCALEMFGTELELPVPELGEPKRADKPTGETGGLVPALPNPGQEKTGSRKTETEATAAR